MTSVSLSVHPLPPEWSAPSRTFYVIAIGSWLPCKLAIGVAHAIGDCSPMNGQLPPWPCEVFTLIFGLTVIAAVHKLFKRRWMPRMLGEGGFLEKLGCLSLQAR